MIEDPTTEITLLSGDINPWCCGWPNKLCFGLNTLAVRFEPDTPRDQHATLQEVSTHICGAEQCWGHIWGGEFVQLIFIRLRFSTYWDNLDCGLKNALKVVGPTSASKSWAHNLTTTFNLVDWMFQNAESDISISFWQAHHQQDYLTVHPLMWSCRVTLCWCWLVCVIKWAAACHITWLKSVRWIQFI